MRSVFAIAQVRRFTEVISMLAVLMLVIVGGSFTHYDGVPHTHVPLDQLASAELEDHGSTKHEHGQPTIDSKNLHCGANIIALEEQQSLQYRTKGHQVESGVSQRLWSIKSGFDPPPPRAFS